MTQAPENMYLLPCVERILKCIQFLKMITTTIVVGTVVAGYRYYKSFGKEPADLITYRYIGDFPDLHKLYCNGQSINLSYFDTPIKQQMIIELLRIGAVSNQIVK